MTRTVFSDATVVAGPRTLTGHSVVVEGGVIVDIFPGMAAARPGDGHVSLPGRVLLPGFIDLHVHGAAGVDVLDGPGAVAAVARTLPKWGVTAFSPTSLACGPAVLGAFLAEVARERGTPARASARVLPAHLESNFISPEYRGAQPAGALTTPFATADDGFSGADVLAVIDAHPGAVGIVTLAPERPGGLDLVKRFVSAGILASIGHSGATLEEAEAAFAVGVSRATHLFSAMPPFSHRQPGLVGAILSRADIFAEMICDGVHVHPAMMRVAIAAKGPDRLVGITDGTAASGLPPGSRTHLGGRPIVARDAARLDDGALAGSVLTMNRALTTLTDRCGMDLAAASRALATTPAHDMRLGHTGIIAPGAAADLVVLDATMNVEQTWVAGVRVWPPADSDAADAYGR